MSLPFTILAAALLSPDVLARWPRRAVLAACFTTLSITLYFFQWTALCLGAGACLGLMVVYDTLTKDTKRKSSILALAALCIGALLGSPQIFYNARIFADPALDPILERIGRGQVMPPGDPYVYVNLVNYWVWLKLVITAVVLWRFPQRGIAMFAAVGAGRLRIGEQCDPHPPGIRKLALDVRLWPVSCHSGLRRCRRADAAAFGSAPFRRTLWRPRSFRPWFCDRSKSNSHPNRCSCARTPTTSPDRPILADIPDDGQRSIVGHVPAQLAAQSMPGGRLLYHFP